jgi:L-methionine (R)-S-oxide reductase
MHSLSAAKGSPADKVALYARLYEEVKAIVEGERDWIANTANCAAILFHSLPNINWAGFYFLKGKDLVLGPFQGMPACVRIGPGRGVCGAAAAKRRTLVVPNVHEFPGHIACDPASNSEIVIPLLSRERLLGVLDIDSPLANRFDADDAAGLQAIVTILLAVSDVAVEGD